jgi:hypothetical protein
MLSAAGVRVDAEKETLLQTTLTLQDQLKESQVALLMEQVCSLQYLLMHFLLVASVSQSSLLGQSLFLCTMF